MLTRTWCLGCAAAVLAQMLALHALPVELAEPGATVWHSLAFASLTLFMWIATGGTQPLAVTGGVMALAGLTFPVGALAAGLTGAILYWRTSCAESSAP